MEDLVFHNHHCHSMFSINDSISKIPQLVKRATELGLKSLTLTDHGTLGGVAELWVECNKAKIKPIIGLEGYFVDSYNSPESQIDYNYSHIILLAKDEEGWMNLKLLQSKAWEEGHLKKPRISWDYLKKYGKGLICTTACIHGLVGWNYLRNNDKFEWEFNDTKKETKERKKKVKERISKFLELFGQDFYFEVHFNEIPQQATLNKYVIKLAQKYGGKILAANDCHYISKKDIILHDIMVSHFHKKKLSDEDNGVYSKHTKQLDFKSTDQMQFSWEAYHDSYMSKDQFIESVKSSLEIRDKIQSFSIKPKMICLPNWSDNPRQDMIDWTEKGFKEKLPKELQEDKRYRERLEYEYNIFDKLGMHAYMLVCADIIERARKLNIPVGPGRGSVCGSLVAYCMDITQIDPIRFDTMFDRFLIASRLSLPDIDMDFGRAGRETIKEAIRQLYGPDRFAAIINYGEWKPKGLMKDIGKVTGRSFQEINDITHKIHPKNGKFVDEEYPMNPEVIKWLKKNKDIYDPALRLEGTYRARGVHASGMILTPTKLEDWVPISYMIDKNTEDKKKVKVSEWDMYYLEDFQILKMDFLGLQTLDVIYGTVDLINKDKKVIDNIWNKCLDDLENKKVYEDLSNGHVTGVFQLETSDGMLQLIKRMKPNKFHDIVMAISLYRTAVIKAGMVDEYLDRREGKKIKYVHPIIKPVLQSTNGILVFQEQLMEIAVVAAGFTRQESDNFRKATKLKDIEKFKPFKDQFCNGCKKNGLTLKESDKLWDWCYKFAGYGFSINHAVAYGLMTYVTAWLKTFYPKEYLASLMSYNAGDEDMMPKYLSECQRLKIEIFNPIINKSSDKFKLTNGKIVHPFTSIKGVGQSVLKAIKEAKKDGPFETFDDFYDRISKRVVNVGVMTKLILADTFREIDNSKEDIFDRFVRMRNEKVYRQMFCEVCKLRFPCTVKHNETDSVVCPACAGGNLSFDEEKCAGKKFSESYVSNQVFGFTFGGNVLKQYMNIIAKNKAEPLSLLEDDDIRDGASFKTAVFVKSIKKWKDKRGNEMAFIDVSDGEFDCSLTVFASDWEYLRKEVQPGCAYILRANKNRGANLLFNTRTKPKSNLLRLGL